jgi:hypothetical protein
MEQEIPIEEADSDSSYRAYLLDRFELLSDILVALDKSYLKNEQNREAHFSVISIASMLWYQLMPKMENTHLENDFKKWTGYINNQRKFFIRGNENKIKGLYLTIRMGFEYLGLTTVENK